MSLKKIYILTLLKGHGSLTERGGRKAQKERKRETEAERGRQRERERGREAKRKRQREREREKERAREREGGTERESHRMRGVRMQLRTLLHRTCWSVSHLCICQICIAL